MSIRGLGDPDKTRPENVPVFIGYRILLVKATLLKGQTSLYIRNGNPT